MTDKDDSFADSMRARREELGISQAGLARSFEEWTGHAMSQQTIAQIERKRRRVSVGEADALASVLDDSVEHMLGGEMSGPAAVRSLARALDQIAGIANSNEVRRAIWSMLGSGVKLDNINHEAWTTAD